MPITESVRFNHITPNPKKYYRISWFGQVSYFDGNKDRPTPVIDVYVVEIAASPPYLELKPSSTVKDQPHKLKVPVAFLGVLNLGDIWHNGQLFQSAHEHYQQERFQDIVIEPENTSTIIARSKRDNSYWLPLNVHPYHRTFTGSSLEVIKVSPTRSIIIPHIVIIQTFFAPDTFVLTQSFKMDLKLDSIYDASKSQIDDVSGHAFIQLRKNVYDESHKVCAMLAFDKVFEKSYKNVSKSLASQKSKGITSLVPQTQMPIEGKHTISAVGQWIRDQADGHWSFLVFQIRTTSLSPPFVYLEYFRDAPGDINPEAERGAGGGTGRNRPRKQTGEEEDDNSKNVDPNKDPNGEHEPLTSELINKSFFPDLNSIPSKKERKAEHKNKQVTNRNRTTGDPKGIGAGDSGEDDARGWSASGSDQQELQHTQKHTFNRPFSRIELFYDVLEKLKAHRQPSLGVSSSEVYSFPKVQLTNRKSTWDNLNYHRDQNQISPVAYKARRVLVTRIRTSSNQTFYLFEIERKMKLASNGWYEVDDYALIMIKHNFLSVRTITELLAQFVRNNGCPSRLEGLTKQTVQHPLNEFLFTEEYATRMAWSIIKATKVP